LALYKRIKYLKGKVNDTESLADESDDEADLESFISNSIQSRLGRGHSFQQAELNDPDTVSLGHIREMSRREKVRSDTKDFSIFEYLEEQYSENIITEDQLDMALVALSAPATQVSVERVFSALAILMQPRRSSLKGAKINDVLVCGLNRNLLELVDYKSFKNHP
jgi:hAT family C-terminal dimerisation region